MAEFILETDNPHEAGYSTETGCMWPSSIYSVFRRVWHLNSSDEDSSAKHV